MRAQNRSGASQRTSTTSRGPSPGSIFTLGTSGEPQGVRALSHGFLVDSGAQDSAVPYHDVVHAGYVPSASTVTGLQAVDGRSVPYYGRVDIAARHGENIFQIGVEVADVEFAVLSTIAVVKRGRSVLNSPLGDWIVDAPLTPPPGAVTLSLKTYGSSRYMEYDELLHAGAAGTTTRSTSLAPLRRTTPPREVPQSSSQSLPNATGPDLDETSTLVPRQPSLPACPTVQERRAHEATHLPYRPWCAECVQGRARGKPHVRNKEPLNEEVVPRVLMDYFFPSPELPRDPGSQSLGRWLCAKMEPTKSVIRTRQHHRGDGDQSCKHF